MQTWWLSFADPQKPVGQRFLGVCVVDVTEGDAAFALLILQTGRFRDTFLPGAEWLSAAKSKAHRENCNPGGEVQGYRIDEGVDRAMLAQIPRNKLMNADELRKRGLA